VCIELYKFLHIITNRKGDVFEKKNNSSGMEFASGNTSKAVGLDKDGSARVDRY